MPAAPTPCAAWTALRWPGASNARGRARTVACCESQRWRPQRGEGKATARRAHARKEALLVELLQRFAEARRDAPATAKKAAKKVAKKAPVKNAGPKKAAAKKAAPKKASVKKTAPKKSAKAATEPKAASAGKAAPKKRASRRGLTPARALENTRSLLEAKHERDRTPQPWQSLDPAADHTPEPGYQSPQAAGKAKELHAGEARLAPIHGSISTRDRRNQGKRDHRNGGSE